jgi:hypothetical protein
VLPQDLVSEADGEPNIGRKISVETACSGSEGHRSVGRRRRHHRRDRKARSTNDLDAAGCDESDSGRPTGQTIRRNLSTSMTLADLRDGIFTAEFPLDALSPVGDIRIRVAGTCLDMFVVDDGTAAADGVTDDDGGNGCNRRKSDCGAALARKDVKDKSGSTTPNGEKGDRRRSSHAGTTGRKKNRNGGSGRGVTKYLGTVDLPIYVDAARLRFDVDRNGRLLLIEGPMKGCCGIGSRCGTLTTSNANRPLHINVSGTGAAADDNDVDADFPAAGLGHSDHSISFDDLRGRLPPGERRCVVGRKELLSHRDIDPTMTGVDISRRLSDGLCWRQRQQPNGDNDDGDVAPDSISRDAGSRNLPSSYRDHNNALTATADHLSPAQPARGLSPSTLLLPPHTAGPAHSKSWPNLRDGPFE